MKISVIAPVKNEVNFIGYSIMAVLPQIHEIIYALAPSMDGTDELLDHIREKYASEKLILLRKPEYDFQTDDMRAYNEAFNDCIDKATGDAVWFLHPDMIVRNPEAIGEIKDGAMAYWTNLESYARDFKTRIVRGRANRWKNIHLRKLGLHYYGRYGSQNEDFYHHHITGLSHHHHGEDFRPYPFEIANSGIQVNHYCELKDYKRRFEKMKACLKNLYPGWEEGRIEEMASKHPRVTLEDSIGEFGIFEFKISDLPIPKVFAEFASEFDAFKKVGVA